jgi:signal transduction histidine kinase
MWLWKLTTVIMVFSLAIGGLATAENQEAIVKTLVEKAAASFEIKGKDHALKLISSLDGGFRKGSIYTFAVSMEGITLSHPANRKLIGRNVINIKGANGKEFMKDFIAVAKYPGSGWVEYWWPRHGEKEASLKRSYIMKVPNYDILVGAGYYR